MRARDVLLTGLALALVAIGVGLTPRPSQLDERAATAVVETPVDTWIEAEIARAQQAGVRPGNEPRLVRHTPGKSAVAFLYLHGFGASRAEGEAVMDPLAEELNANLLYGLLPGHGTDDPDYHALPGPREYLQMTAQALHEARQLGDHLVVVGSSTGGLLATWLAAEHPDQVEALILASPFFEFRDPMARLLDTRLGPILVPMVQGPDRYAGWTVNPDNRVQQPGYDAHWTTHQRTSALFGLADLRRHIATPETFARVRAPALILAYEADEEHQDTVVSVHAMRAALGLFGGAAGSHPASRLVKIADGNHILTSAYVRTDKDTINKEIRSFLGEVLPAPPEALEPPDGATP